MRTDEEMALLVQMHREYFSHLHMQAIDWDTLRLNRKPPSMKNIAGVGEWRQCLIDVYHPEVQDASASQGRNSKKRV